MPPLPRAKCPKCGKSVPLRRNGVLREHNGDGGWECDWSGWPPEETPGQLPGIRP